MIDTRAADRTLRRMVIVGRPALVVAALLLPAATWLWFGSVSDVGDGVYHYLAAHLAFTHPAILLDPWCKPLFTLLASPLAWIGFPGMLLFQSLATGLSATLLWRIGAAREMRYPWIAPLLLLLAPGTAQALLSGLTEPLFGVILIAAVWSCERERWGLSYLLIGLLPFVRAEGWILMLWWGILALCNRRLWLLAPLACGHVLYSLVGTLFVFHDPLWMFDRNPYWVSDRPYGHGTWEHFFVKYPYVAGAPLAAATVVAGVLLAARCARWIMQRRRDADAARDERWLLYYFGSFAAYFLAHVVFWRFGLFKSFGLERVLVAILPVAALIVGREWDLLARRMAPALVTIVTSGLAVALLLFAFGDHATALRLGDLLRPREQQIAIDEAVLWLRTLYATPRDTPLVYFSSPYVALALDLDILDGDRALPVDQLNSTQSRPGALLVWDSWYSVVEHDFAAAKLDHLPLEERQSFVATGGSGERYEVVTGRFPLNESSAPFQPLPDK